MLTTRLPPFAETRPPVRRAVEWALIMHADQRREVDQAPFVLHPLEVASLLNGRDFDDDVVTAGVLHDIVENTSVTLDDVHRRFGSRVARLVAAVTENPSIQAYAARKSALRDQVAAAGRDACAIYAADKVAKVRELRGKAIRDPSELLGRKLEHYRASLEMLRASTQDLALVDQLEFELWALDVLPPSQPDNSEFTAA
ncbi:bifunctional (p)ppGpp synthetase/guanosine-3',5'-bis(diphosphate) 3'-pyrophosphohydrolase [Solirubrobacter sp. CPCC 204708]|uniref:HD domain-containing protein n=1 Tax=Solirubrobacter deserti TaxID=2282478 RepID=A0ABT4RUN2_9ACTN|nr:HD domain-containing protein [Solirubrobacter deserti]MBE2320022.1 bifunctional (p)ppGpp synthetase/guanosine-3',5'-bis(diphosphate) 3'-pyrophosphohydrolase [Solirubrobacter deserti]MDA0141966.1 HD domain-containing protein [Solirubrobacter deserti]